MRIYITDTNNKLHEVDIIGQEDIKYYSETGKFEPLPFIGNLNKVCDKAILKEIYERFEPDDLVEVDTHDIEDYDLEWTLKVRNA